MYMSNAANTSSTIRGAGFTQDINECECCGRSDLKGTVRMLLVDSDGNGELIGYYGVRCAAAHFGRTAKEIRSEAKAADAAAREADYRARRVAADAQYAALEASWTARYGTADRCKISAMTGMSSYEIACEAQAALEAA